jgi:hypothetical protein
VAERTWRHLKNSSIITTIVEAAKYIEDMQRPIIDKWAPVIEAA